MSTSIASSSSHPLCVDRTNEGHEKDNPSFDLNQIVQDEQKILPPPRSRHSSHEYSHNFHSHKGDDIFLMLLENRRAHWNVGIPPSHAHFDVDAREDHSEIEDLAVTIERSCSVRSNCSVLSDVSSISSDGGYRASEGNKVVFIKKSISRDGNSHSSGGSGMIVLRRSGRFVDLDNDIRDHVPYGLSPCEELDTPPTTPPRTNSKDSNDHVSPNTTTPPTKKKKLFSLKKMLPKFLRRRGNSFHFPSEAASVSSNGTDSPTRTAANTSTGTNQQAESPSRPRFLRRLTL